MKKPSRKKELLYQRHIIDSYKMCGGYAAKWATDLSVGKPDLVCALDDFGCHLVEVKHRPDWSMDHHYKNPLTDKQVQAARDYINAGGISVSMVVVGRGSMAIDSKLYVFSSLAPTVCLSHCMFVEYKPTRKFNVSLLMHNRGFRT